MKSIKKIPLGIPLMIASAGTAVTCFAGKRLHAGFGIALTVLSLVHGIQHAHQLRLGTKRNLNQVKEASKQLSAKFRRMHFLVETDIASFMPGRIRVYNKALIGRADMAELVKAYVASFEGVRDVVISLETGSCLITYDVQIIRASEQLARVEQYIAQNAPISVSMDL